VCSLCGDHSGVWGWCEVRLCQNEAPVKTREALLSMVNTQHLGVRSSCSQKWRWACDGNWGQEGARGRLEVAIWQVYCRSENNALHLKDTKQQQILQTKLIQLTCSQIREMEKAKSENSMENVFSTGVAMVQFGSVQTLILPNLELTLCSVQANA
jgi:hypothetical protein